MAKENKGADIIGSEQLALINRYSRKELKADDVYTFSVVLCDNEIDRDKEHFSDEALDKLAEMFVGVTGIYDHDPSAKNQVARIYAAKAEEVPGRVTSYGAAYRRIVARAYIPRCKSSEELIEMLDSGIKKEVSVGCGIGSCTCSICGEDMRTHACEHTKGEVYDGKLCCGILSDPTDAYEWSFIAVPAQKNAGVIKSFIGGARRSARFDEASGVLTHEDVEELKSYIASLKKRAEEGERYKASLRLEAVKAGITAKVGIESSLLESMVSSLSVDELLRLKSGFEETASRLLPIRPQTLSPAELGESRNAKGYNEYNI